MGTKKITYITTLNHNPGDDFIRQGIHHFAEQRWPDAEYSYVNKHIPTTVIEELDSLRIERRSLQKLADWLIRSTRFGTDKLKSADLIIQAGAPVYWLSPESKCSDAEWVQPLWYNRISALYNQTPVVNVAAGACQRYDSDCLEIVEDPQCRKYIEDIHRMCQFTTTRDRYAHGMLNSIGLTNELLPCTSLFARDSLRLQEQERDLILFNYMPGGSHFSWGQPIHEKEWEQVFFTLFNQLSRSEECVIVCHNQREYEVAAAFVDVRHLFISKDYRDYLKLFSRGKYGIFNRIHAAFGLVSWLAPAVVVGTDTRAKMIEEMGLPHFFVNDASIEKLSEVVTDFEQRNASYRDQLGERKREAEMKYRQLFQDL